MNHTALAADTRLLKEVADARWLEWHRLESMRAAPLIRQEAWQRYDAAWQAYLEAARVEAAEAADAVLRIEGRRYEFDA